MMKLRIVSDGTVEGTRLETEDGELIEGVISLQWSLDAHSGAKLSFTRVSLIGVSAEIVGKVIEQLTDAWADD